MIKAIRKTTGQNGRNISARLSSFLQSQDLLGAEVLEVLSVPVKVDAEGTARDTYLTILRRQEQDEFDGPVTDGTRPDSGSPMKY